MAWGYAAATALLAVLATTLRDGWVIQGALALTSAAAAWYGATRNRPADLLPWRLLSIAGAVVPLALAVTALSDLLCIPAYFLMLAAIVRMVRDRGGLAHAGEAIDVAVATCAAWMLAWVFTIEPAMGQTGGAVADIVHFTYPTVTAASLFFFGVFLTTGALRNVAFRFLLGSFVLLEASDLIWAVGSLGVPAPTGLTPMLYTAAYGGVATAALHPSMRAMTSRVVRPTVGMTPLRLTLVGAGMLVPLAVLLSHPPRTPVSVAVLGATSAVLTALVVVRLVLAVNAYARSEQRLSVQATHDGLTALPNRALLEKRLRAYLADPERTGIGVFYLDLDRFKQVNDTLGHPVGDELLVAVAHKLATLVRTHSGPDFVTRVSGDEFVVVCTAVPDEDHALRIGHRLQAVFDTPIALAGGPLLIHPSIGVTFAAPSRAGVTVDDLLREADIAMYRSKKRGRAQVSRFDTSMAEADRDRQAMEDDLAAALEVGGLSLHYQPVIDLASGRPSGLEALMRWDHPTRGSVPPAQFIPVAEDTGAIIALGRWALNQAIGQLARWQQDHPALTMSVNISARQLRDGNLVDDLAEALSQTRIRPETVFLEVTETAMLEDVEAAGTTFERLKELGVRLSTDDFGTGYSSLAFLRRYPIDQVKIDRTFVAGLGDSADDRAIVGAVLSMARSLHLDVVAEGVETRQQELLLLELGCRKAQGWLYARALPADAIPAYLQTAGQPELQPTA